MVVRAGWVKLANRQAGYLSSLSLIRAGGTQRESCSARQPATAGKEATSEVGRWRNTKSKRAGSAATTYGCRCSRMRKKRSNAKPGRRA
ncbi:hypothetical protein CAL23_12585 [Bordetella genomosp. 6]|uniref:Uncharacterized protein n=1 Tax=Bordetella genomosp. 6 TaxID=463024 RepID=A0ABX4FCW5_9BORD|nr:hypothetical protein CAL23_12585 [Bordetella genomosp. 6]